MRPNHVHLGATALPAGRGRPALALAIAGFWLLSLACGATAQQAGTAPAAGIPSLAKVPIGELDDIPGLPGDDAPDGTRSGDAGKAEPPLPAEAVSRHSLTLPDRRLSFTARAGAMAIPPATPATWANLVRRATTPAFLPKRSNIYAISQSAGVPRGPKRYCDAFSSFAPQLSSRC